MSNRLEIQNVDWGTDLPEIVFPSDEDIAAIRAMAAEVPTPEARIRIALEKGWLRDFSVNLDPALRHDLLGRAIRRKRVQDLASLVARFDLVTSALGIDYPNGDNWASGPSISLHSSRIENCHLATEPLHWPLEIYHCQCPAPAHLHGSTLLGPVSFVGTTFHDSLDISMAAFHGPVRFDSARFLGEVEFLSAEFHRPVSFKRANFRAAVQFGFATSFRDTVDYSSAAFHSPAGFEGATFHKDVTFHAADFSQPLDLRDARFENVAHLGFSELRFRGSTMLGGNLLLRCGQLRLGRWPKYRGRLIGERSRDPAKLLAACEQYGALQANFTGQSSPDAPAAHDWCHYRYMDLHRKTHGLRLAKGHAHGRLLRGLDWLFLKWAFGYGVILKRILITGLIVMLLFALLYFTNGGGLSDNTWAVRNAAGSTLSTIHPWPARLASSLYFSWESFATISYGDWRPEGLAKLASSLEGLSGILVLLLFTVCFARKMLK